jgi:hypothetical protein
MTTPREINSMAYKCKVLCHGLRIGEYAKSGVQQRCLLKSLELCPHLWRPA